MASIPLLILCVIGGMRDFCHSVLKRKQLELAFKCIALVSFYIVCHLTPFPLSFDDEYFKLGYAYHVQQRTEEAKSAYKRALEINPTHPSALKNLKALTQN
jgi:tetratricopeptide (TPR) repeat protein